jgi:hypothetical protein
MLGVGQKVDTGGFNLWINYLAGDKQARQDMIDYNAQDVLLLEEVYLKLRPWMNNHPNIGLFNDDDAEQCPKCGSKHIHWRGHAYTTGGRYPRFQCQDCGGWGRGRVHNHDKEKRASLVTNAQ